MHLQRPGLQAFWQDNNILLFCLILCQVVLLIARIQMSILTMHWEWTYILMSRDTAVVKRAHFYLIQLLFAQQQATAKHSVVMQRASI